MAYFYWHLPFSQRHSLSCCFTAGEKSHAVYETTPFFSFHHANAFEASRQQLVVDTVAMTGIDFSNSFESGKSIFERPSGKGVATRLVIDGTTGKVSLFSSALIVS